MLLFWILAAYTLTRVPRSPVSLAVAATQVVTAAYLLGQAMLANAESLADWQGWSRSLQWGVTLGPVLWFGLTLLLLRDQKDPALARYLRIVGYPLGIMFALLGVWLTIGIYIGDALYVWSAPIHLSPTDSLYFHFRARSGPLYPGLVGLLVGTTLGAIGNTWLGWRRAADPDRRRHFSWLLLSAALVLLGIGPAAVANWLNLGFWPTWLGHLFLAAGQLVLVSDIAAYSFVLQGKVVRRDFLSFLTTRGALLALYIAVLIVASPGYSFRWLGFAATVLIVVILSHSLIEVSPRFLDRVFFAPDVRRLRSDLATAARDAAQSQDLAPVLSQVQSDLAEVSTERDVRLVEEALRRLNNAAALARCGLLGHLPATLAATTRRPTLAAEDPSATPLERARALREVLTSAIERLKPADSDGAPDSPGSLQYTILHEEYVLGAPNKQIMRRHALSEGTFHRQRRAAVEILAAELARQEARLAAAERVPEATRPVR